MSGRSNSSLRPPGPAESPPPPPGSGGHSVRMDAAPPGGQRRGDAEPGTSWKRAPPTLACAPGRMNEKSLGSRSQGFATLCVFRPACQVALLPMLLDLASPGWVTRHARVPVSRSRLRDGLGRFFELRAYTDGRTARLGSGSKWVQPPLNLFQV